MKKFVLYLGTPAFAFVEWLMFELLRTPYRPPHDMLTVLGTEKYGLVAYMIAIGLVWVGAVAVTIAMKAMKWLDYFAFVVVVVMILALIQYIVRNPGRLVTPWDLLWS